MSSAAQSAVLSLGSPAPDFALPDTVSGKTVRLSEVKSDAATVVLFICNHCPYVKHVAGQLVQLANDYGPKGVAIVAVSSNDAIEYPDDAPDKMKAEALRMGYPFPYLYDESQGVARAYGAVCTPDTFVFDGNLKLAYRGQLDDTRPGGGQPATGADVRAALDAILACKPVPSTQKPSVGCSIKWKQG